MIRLGTRRSALATAQSQQTADALAAVAGVPVELVPITSEGDVSRASLSELGGQGVFATRLREALLAGECDLLVHSLKDLPTAPAPGLVIAALPVREDARDVVVTRDGTALHELPAGAVVGTGSPRRVAQLHIRNPRITARDIRGNVDSRLGRVRDGELDAVILAAAGLVRLGGLALDLSGEPLGLSEWPTAPGQGALAVETRDDAPAELRAALAQLDDLPTRVAVAAERAVLAGLEAGCHAPVGVHAEVIDGYLRVRAVVYALDGSARVGTDRTLHLMDGYAEISGSGNGAIAAGDADPETRARRTGEDVARELLDRGAADVSS
ncbi:MAG: hydroxymethylbilane synthase [Microbacterium sp.]|uniref:hydroxymethylbilane synthase n=1 Tax=Microbacterium sp. TaxID=51671 RepID=UPI00262E6185|nr:hydroxymethylbilane synthase [Microbacterium sp.]MCX6502544.1 hydroxymethylbilane synthase [Microbacterium sp.]